MILRNNGILPRHYRMSQQRRLRHESSLPWKLQRTRLFRRIILNWILDIQIMKIWIGIKWLRRDQN